MSPTLAVRVAHGAVRSGAGSWAIVCRLLRRLPVFRSTRSPHALAALLLPPLLVLAGCGGSAKNNDAAATSAASEQASWPVTVTGTNGEVTLDAQPEAIVSLSATATEMLFAIGAGPQVEAVDSTSNYPTDAPTTDLSAFTPNAEAIAKYNPDLVVLSDDMNGIVDALDALDVPTLQLGAAKTIDDTYAQLETLGDATGHAEEADEVIADVQDRIAAAVDSVGAGPEGLRVYHELDPSLYSAGSSTFIGSI